MRRLFALIAFGACLSLFSCSEVSEDNLLPYAWGLRFDVRESELVFDYWDSSPHYQEQKIEIDCEHVSWKIEGLPDWLTASETSGGNEFSDSYSYETIMFNVDSDIEPGDDLKDEFFIIANNSELGITAKKTIKVTKKVPALQRTISPSSLSVPAKAEGMMFFLRIRTNEQWYLNTDVDWIQFPYGSSDNPHGQVSVYDVAITVKDNESENARAAFIIYHGADGYTKKITVTQSGVSDPGIVTPTELSFPAEGGDQTVTVEAFSEWGIYCPDESWRDLITLTSDSPVYGSAGKSDIVIRVAPNTSSSPRTTTLLYRDDAGETPINITQAGVGETIIDPMSLEFGSQGGSEELTISTATAWSFTYVPDWVSVSPDSGPAGTHNVVVTANKSTSVGGIISSNLVYRDENFEKTIVLSQYCLSPMTITPTSMKFSGTGETKEINLSSETDWYFYDVPNWIKLSENSGSSGEYVISVTVGANPDKGYSRSGQFRCTDGITDIAISIEQEAYNPNTVEFNETHAIVNAVVPGKLQELLGDNANMITDLTVVGKLDGDDLNYMGILSRDASLRSLYITDADIVASSNWQFVQKDNKIQYNYFRDSKIEIIHLPNSLVEISGAFLGIETLKTVVFGDNLETIGDSAFDGCSGLQGDLVIPDGVSSIGSCAFRNTGFTGTLTIPSSVKTIGSHAFQSVKFTGDLIIPEGVISIGDAAFNVSTFSGELHIADSVTTIGESAFLCCDGFTGDLVIPDSITKIESSAFHGCDFSGLVLPNSITEIGSHAFCECRKLTGNLRIPNNVTSIGASAFSDCGFTGDLIIPNSVTTIGDDAFIGCDGFTGDLIIPNSVTSIGNDAFRACSGFTGNLIIPNSVTSVGEGAFYYCYGFDGTLKISENLLHIGNQTFGNCTHLSGVLTIPDNVNSIGEEAFKGCSGFSKLVLHDNIEVIGASAFYECTGFSGKLILPKHLRKIGVDAFFYCSGFYGDLMIPEGVSVIEDGAFGFCKGFNGNLIISDNVTRIGVNAFNSCSFTGELRIPDSVTTIGACSFYYCYGFTSIYIGKSVVSIGNMAFSAVSSAQTLVIPDSVESIGQSAFSFCGIETLTLGYNLNNIGIEAFRGNFNLSKVKSKAIVPPNFAPNTWEEVDGSAVLEVPAGSVDAYKASDWANYFSEINAISE